MPGSPGPAAGPAGLAPGETFCKPFGEPFGETCGETCGSLSSAPSGTPSGPPIGKPFGTPFGTPFGKPIYWLFGLLLLGFMAWGPYALAQSASVRAELSASTISLDESVTLTIRAIGVEGEPDMSALSEVFDVLGQSSSREISTVNRPGSAPEIRSVTTWTVELMAREAGVFTVPAVTIGGVSSQLLSLTVNEVPAGARRDVFVEASVDVRRPWVQSQVLMTLKVYQAVELVEGSLADPAGADLLVQRIGEDAHLTETREGTVYRVTERRYALFPQISGTVTIDPVQLNVTVPAGNGARRGIFAPTRRLIRRTRPIELEVQARPDGGSGWWLPASAVQIDSEWSGTLDPADASATVSANTSAGATSQTDSTGNDDLVARVGQPLTRTLRLRAGGVMASQLPDIGIPALENVSVYAEEPARALGMNERGLVAEQSVQWALIPQTAGELVLPEVRIDWFDTEDGRPRVALLPEERIRVVVAGNDSDSSGSAEQGAPTGAAAPPTGMSPTDTTDQGTAQTEALAPGDPARPAGPTDVAREPESAPRDVQATNEAMSGEDSLAVAVADADASHADPGARPDALAGRDDKAGTSALTLEIWRLLALFSMLVCVSSLGLAWHWRRRYRHWQTRLADELPMAHEQEQESPAISAQASTAQAATLSSPGVGAGRRLRSSSAWQRLMPLAQVKEAVNTGDPADLRQALLAWSARQWPESAPTHLLALADRLDHGEAARLVRELDAGFYGPGLDTEQRRQLMQSMQSLPELLEQALTHESGSSVGRSTRSAGVGLPPL